MCVAIKFRDSETRWNATGASLPVIDTDTGELKQYPWGRREWNEDGRLYPTGWARSESIEQGKWNRFHPKEVKIQADSFMERDNNKNPHWVELDERQFIAGLLVSSGEEIRVYVITVSPPEARFKRWPKLIYET